MSFRKAAVRGADADAVDSAHALRLLRLARRLWLGERFTVSGLMAEYGITRRTVNRDLNLLSEAMGGLRRVALGEGNLREWSLDPGVEARGTVQFTDYEVIALLMSRNLLHLFRGTVFEDHLDAVFEKLESHLGHGSVIFKAKRRKAQRREDLRLRQKFFATAGLFTSYQAADQRGALDDIIDALLAECRIRIRYRRRDGTTARSYDIQPLSLLIHQGGLYLVGFVDREETKRRTFAVEGIEATELLRNQPYAYPSDYDPEALWRHAFGLVAGEREPIEVTLHFDTVAAPLLRARRPTPSEEPRELPDGGLELKVRVEPNVEFRGWLMSHGPHVRVVEPADLAKELQADLYAAWTQYGTPPPPALDPPADGEDDTNALSNPGLPLSPFVAVSAAKPPTP